MEDVFISYARVDMEKAKIVSEYLSASGRACWWDVNLQPGQVFRDEIRRRIDAAQYVVVIWSHASVSSDFVLDEAGYAKQQGKLIPLRIDNCSYPFGFGSLHTHQISVWPSDLSPLLTRIGGARGQPTAPAPATVIAEEDRAPRNGSASWEFERERLVGTLNGHRREVTHLDFSRVRPIAVSSSADKTLRIWDLSNVKEIRKIKAQPTWFGQINWCGFSPDGRFVLSNGTDSTLRIWNIEDGTLIKSWRWGQRSMACVSHDGKFIAGADRRTIALWDLSGGHEMRRFLLPRSAGKVVNITFSRSSQNVVCSTESGQLQILDPLSGTIVQSLRDHSGRTCFVAAPHGLDAVSGDSRGVIKLWNSVTESVPSKKSEPDSSQEGEAARGPESLPQLAEAVIKNTKNGNWSSLIKLITPGERPAQAPPSGSLRFTKDIWGVKSGTSVGSISCLAISSDSTKVLTGGLDHRVMLWDVTAGKPLRTFEGHSGPVTSVAFTYDGKYALSGSSDCSLKLWDLVGL